MLNRDEETRKGQLLSNLSGLTDKELKELESLTTKGISHLTFNRMKKDTTQ